MTDDFIEVDLKPSICVEGYSLFNKLRVSDTFCDVSLITDGGKLNAHKLVLSSGSPYFLTMFTSSMKEANMEEINIPDINYDTMERIIYFIYTSQLKISTDSAQNLLIAANFLQMPLLVDLCGKYIMRKIDTENCFLLKELLITTNCDKETVARANDYINSHFLQIVQNESFLQLDIDGVVKLLSRSNLCCTAEEDVFHAAVRWLEASDERKQSAQRIFQCIRLSRLSDKFKEGHLINNPIFATDIINEPIDPSKLTRTVKTSVLALSCGESNSTLKIYDSSTKQWVQIMDMKERNYGRIATSKNHIFVSGLEPGRRLGRLDFYRVFDRTTKEWTEMPSRSHRIRQVGMVTVGEKLYVFMRLSRRSMTSVVYNTVKKRWSTGPELIANVDYSPRIVALDKCIYVFGTNYEGEAQKLNTITKTWNVIAPFKNKRSSFKVATYKGKIYAAGGYVGRFDELSYVNIFEVYDPSTNVWKELTPMPIACSPLLVGTTDGIYAFNWGSVYFYDVARDEWRTEGMLPENFTKLSVAAIPDSYQD